MSDRRHDSAPQVDRARHQPSDRPGRRASADFPRHYTHPDGRPWLSQIPEERRGTLACLQRYDMTIRLDCLGCRRDAVVLRAPRVAALVRRHGAATPLQAWLERLVCQHCGGRWPWIDLSVSIGKED